MRWPRPPHPQSHLEDVRAHLGGGGPLGAELHGEGQPVLRQHAHLSAVHQHADRTHALLLHGVVQHQVPTHNISICILYIQYIYVATRFDVM